MTEVVSIDPAFDPEVFKNVIYERAEALDAALQGCPPRGAVWLRPIARSVARGAPPGNRLHLTPRRIASVPTRQAGSLPRCCPRGASVR